MIHLKMKNIMKSRKTTDSTRRKGRDAQADPDEDYLDQDYDQSGLEQIGPGTKGEKWPYLGKSVRDTGDGRDAGAGIEHQYYTKAVD